MNTEAFNRYLRQIRNSEQAFCKIYEYYLPKIKYHVISKYGNSVDFEDVAHDAFTRIIRLENPPEVENPTAWIYKICDNVANDHLQKKRGQISLDERLEAPPPASVITISSAESDLDYFTLLSMLDASDAEIVRLVTWEGYNLKEAADIMGISHGAARQRYSRALKKLGALLKNIGNKKRK